jgi:hypothetical protein
MDQTLKKGTHFVCAHGLDAQPDDIVVGVLESVRSNGSVIVLSLINNKPLLLEAVKLKERHVLVPKKKALRVVTCCEDEGIDAARVLAAKYAREETACAFVPTSRHILLSIYGDDTRCSSCAYQEHTESSCDLFGQTLALDRVTKRRLRCESCLNCEKKYKEWLVSAKQST